MLDVLEVIYGCFIPRRYSAFGVLMCAKHYCATKIFIFTTNKGIEIAIEKSLEDCLCSCFSSSDDENELICLVIRS